MYDLLCCLRCRTAGLRRDDQSLTCCACGSTFPISCGVPLLLNDIRRFPSGQRLDLKSLRRVCQIAYLRPNRQTLAELDFIFSHNYHLGEAALTAENNYFL